MPLQFRTPQVIVTGRGAHEWLTELEELKGKACALLLVDEARVEREIEKRCAGDLKSLGIEVAEFREIGSQVTSDELLKGLERVRSRGVDVIVAAGGRNVMQAAKILALMATNGEEVVESWGTAEVKKPAMPVIALAMTAGSGAAIAQCACYMDSETKTRRCVAHPNLMPAAAILDPGLKSWQAPDEMACDGIVSVGFAVESLTSKLSTPVTDACALAAFVALVRWLPVSYALGADLAAREQVMYAQQMVSIAMSNCSCAVICKLAGQIEARTRIPFGHAVSALLPPMLEFYEKSVPEKVREIAEALRKGGVSVDESSERLSAADLMTRFIQSLDLPLRLSFLGMEETVIPELAAAIDCRSYASTTPRPVDEKVLTAILNRAL